ncbi:unnamed protein product [Urochloa decumbens]|uniref:Transmembrane protein n=1 Tax=Urochloa decumbens TaxID=240449 RepID=A0ABC9DCW3_9POAL
MGFLAIFFRISYAALLSVAATHFIGSNSGAAVATLVTFYAAGIFGHTIAEHVQRAESEAMFTPPSVCNGDQRQKSGGKGDQRQQSDDKDGMKQQSDEKDDMKQQFGGKDDLKQQSGGKDDVNQHNEPLMCFLFVHGVLSLLVLVRMLWVVLYPGSVMFMVATDNHDSEVSLVVEEFSLETLFIIWPWACFVAVILQKGTVVSMSTMVYKVPAYAAALYILSAVLSIALGEAYGLLALWPAPMAMVGLFGYIIAMFSRYNHIRASLSKDQQHMVQMALDEPEQKESGSGCKLANGA